MALGILPLEKTHGTIDSTSKSEEESHKALSQGNSLSTIINIRERVIRVSSGEQSTWHHSVTF